MQKALSLTWEESTVTWANQPAIESTILSAISFTPSPTLVWKCWYNDTNNMAINSTDLANNNISYYIHDSTEDSSSSIMPKMRAKEHASGSRPQLVITYTEAPSGTQYNLTANESMAMTFGASRQLTAKRVGTSTLTLSTDAEATKTSAEYCDYNIDDCQILYDDNSIYCLSNDIITTDIPCLTANVTNITIDCVGYNITGPNITTVGAGINDLTGTGIYLNIKNCNVYNWYFGIDSQKQGMLIQNTTISNNHYGVYYGPFAHYGIITNSTISDNNYGVFIYYSNNTIINDSFIIDNIQTGLTESNNTFNTLVYNNLFNNSNNFDRLMTSFGNNSLNITNQAGTRVYSSGTNIGGNYWVSYSDSCSDVNCDGYCDEPYDASDNDIDYLPYSDEWLIDGCVGNMTNCSATLILSLSSSNYRKGLFNRTDSLSLAMTGNGYKRAFLNRLENLALAFAPNSYRKMIMNRLNSLSLTFAENSYRKAIMNRLNSLAITITSSAYKTIQQIYSRLAELSLTFTSNSYRKAILNRVKSLLITLVSGRSVYTAPAEVEPFYQVCAAKFQFGDTPIFLCVFGDGTWKLFITGAEIP
jgi:hypothetical protein